jgi:hypothetical protein
MQFMGWDAVAQHFQGRTARQCRERWVNYLSPQVRIAPWTIEEDQLLCSQVAELGHAWTLISRAFYGRSENDVKNRWYTHLQPYLNARFGSETERKKRIRAPVDAKGNAMRLIAQSARQEKPEQCETRSETTIELELFDGEGWENYIWD